MAFDANPVILLHKLKYDDLLGSEKSFESYL